MIRLIWIPVAMLLYVLGAYLSYKNNLYGGKWFVLSFLLGAFPIWQLIARFSNDLLIDGIIFDIIIVIAYVVTISILTQGYFTWTWKHITGLVLMLSGLILFKI
jgi:hypothetical protein